MEPEEVFLSRLVALYVKNTSFSGLWVLSWSNERERGGSPGSGFWEVKLLWRKE